MARRPGSGLSNTTAASIEKLVAAVLRDDEQDITNQQQALTNEFNHRRCGIKPQKVIAVVRAAIDALGLDTTDAVAQPDDGLGDIRVDLRNGRQLWFEVKAQTKKNHFADLTQADWVRDETDLVRWLVSYETPIANRLPTWALDVLRVPTPDSYFDGWNRDSLWLADMALIVNQEVREQASVYTPDDLSKFLRRKYVIHLTREGIRIIRLDSLKPVASTLAGTPVKMLINDTNKTAVSIAFSCPGPPSYGRVHFTYHIAYPSGVLGRHKMHARSIGDADPQVEILT